MSKKVLLVTPRFPIPSAGACEQDRLEGIKQLKRLGYEVHVISKVFDFQDREKINSFSEKFDIPIHLVPYRYLRNTKGLKKIIRLVKRIFPHRNKPVDWMLPRLNIQTLLFNPLLENK